MLASSLAPRRSKPPALAAAERALGRHAPPKPAGRTASRRSTSWRPSPARRQRRGASELTHEIDESEQEERAALDIFYRQRDASPIHAPLFNHSTSVGALPPT